MPTIVLKLSEHPPESMRCLDLAGRHVLVIHTDGAIRVVDALCTHAGAPLAEGTIEGHRLICPWHGGAFDLRDGRPLIPPASIPLDTWPATVDGDEIRVEMD